MEETPVHALDYLSVVRRRLRWLIAPIALSAVVGILLARFLPKEYKSSTTLGVAAPVVSPNLVSQSSSLNIDDRLRAISQQLLSLQILDRVLKEETQGGRTTDLQMADLQRAIEITVPDPVATVSAKRLDTFVVSYSDEDPVRAQRITGRLAAVFVDENSKSRTERAEDTSAFIATQLRTSQARLADLEARLRQSKEAHMGQLPEQTQANLQMVAGLRQQVEANATTLRGEQDRLTMIERQIEAYNQDNDAALTAKGKDGPASPEARMAAVQQELAAARSAYTSKHPEVIRLEGELAAAQREVQAGRGKPMTEQAARATDPAYRQLLQDRDATRLRVAEIQRSGADYQRQIGLYQARVEAAPMVEQQLATVQRDYDLEKQQYSDLSTKLHSSTIAENVERNRSGEQFTVIYPASYPLTPTKPVLWRLMVMVIAAGAVAGATLAFGREYLDRSVHDARTLKDEFDLAVLGEISHIKA
jgi:polysaccharide chain length determinant protein (PEP-CTERM system associated)